MSTASALKSKMMLGEIHALLSQRGSEPVTSNQSGAIICLDSIFSSP
jgi:hypothetical protein